MKHHTVQTSTGVQAATSVQTAVDVRDRDRRCHVIRLMDLLRETLSAFNANRGRSLLTVLGIVIGIGLIFGFWPARRASKLNPVEPLRYQ